MNVFKFKRFMDDIHFANDNSLTDEKKYLVLILPYLDSIFSEIRAKLKKSLKISLIVVKCR